MAKGSVPEGRAPAGSVDRAFDLYTAAVSAGGGMRLAEAALATGLSKPTAHRILQILVGRGLLRQDPDRSYRLGAQAFALAVRSLDQLEYAKEAQVGISWLQAYTPEAIHVAAMLGDSAVYIAKSEGSQPYRMASRVGAPLLLHCTSIGKSVLAHLPPDELAERLSELDLPRRTATTLTRVKDLRVQLDQIQAQGFAIDDEENEDNIRCVGAPVFGASGRVVAGISISAPTFNMSLDQAIALGPSVARAGAMISAALGAPEELARRA